MSETRVKKPIVRKLEMVIVKSGPILREKVNEKVVMVFMCLYLIFLAWKLVLKSRKIIQYHFAKIENPLES